MRILVLGAGAGGGVPQWNCNCPVCRVAWDSDGRVAHRTQSSIAVSTDGDAWCLINCSPDLRHQIIANRQLHPRHPDQHGRRDTPIAAVVLTNADVDHVAGLLTMREKQAFRLFATGRVLDVLTQNQIFAVLDPDHVERIRFSLDEPTEVIPGLSIEAFTVPGKIALYLEGGADAEGSDLAIGAQSEDTIGLKISTTDGAKSAFHIPGCAAMTDDLENRIRGAELVLFDGTVWHNDEMIAQKVGQKTGHRMGHMSMAGPDGSIAALAGLNIRRKVFIHINNTNPVLLDGSPQHAEVTGQGWELAYDGLELTL
jgi:pyrroloquinoline quinone biosynthesis protein B